MSKIPKAATLFRNKLLDLVRKYGDACVKNSRPGSSSETAKAADAAFVEIVCHIDKYLGIDT